MLKMKVIMIICMFLAVASAFSFKNTKELKQPLQITVLIESLCPDSRDFITNSYARAIGVQGIEMLAEITIVPFGNAREVKKDDHYEFTCQQGDAECYGNTLQSCLFAHIDKKAAQKIMVCVESKISADGDWIKAFGDCGHKLRVDVRNVLYCANTAEGNNLTHEAAQKTDSNHKYVPWVLVDGVHDPETEKMILDDLVGYACSQSDARVNVPACQSRMEQSLVALKDHKPLDIVIYTESLCYACLNFIVTSFADAIKTKGIEKIANITIVPYGNAKEEQKKGHYVYDCQHGPDECLGNAIQNCILAQKEKSDAQRAIVCLEIKRRGGMQWNKAIDACTAEQKIDLSGALACARGADGEKYMHQAAQNTDKNHRYVPWITVNGVHDANGEEKIRSNLVKYACENYQGEHKIDACESKTALSLKSYGYTWKNSVTTGTN